MTYGIIPLSVQTASSQQYRVPVTEGASQRLFRERLSMQLCDPNRPASETVRDKKDPVPDYLAMLGL